MNLLKEYKPPFIMGLWKCWELQLENPLFNIQTSSSYSGVKILREDSFLFSAFEQELM